MEILLRVAAPVKEIILDAYNLAFWKCKVELNNDFIDCSYSVNPEAQSLAIQFPQPLNNEIKLQIDYTGVLPATMEGFYRSTYKKDGEEKHLATTQFETIQARKAFPCFDHPCKKATFDIEFVIEEHLTGISNMPIEEEKSLKTGKKLVKFQRTIKMPPYLLYFGIAEWDFIEDPGEVVVRVATTPGKAKHGKTALEFGRKCLDYCEELFRLKYPIGKMDLIAVPDFAAGAMENYGAITFREQLLLYYPGITPASSIASAFTTLAHEIVHMWFGDLVSPADWKYLWLNEGFATLYGYLIVEHFYPDWNRENEMIKRLLDSSLERDAYRDTVPIELPGDKKADITLANVDIIYSKAGAILRMVRGHLGDDFLKGIHHYLERFSFAGATSEDFWESLEENSSIPIVDMMESWAKQPGYPILNVKRENDELVISQSRFSLLPLKTKQTWLIPVSVWFLQKNGESKVIKQLIGTKTAKIPINSDVEAYKVNYGQTSFVRVNYLEPGLLEKLGKLISKKKLPAIDRWGIETDLFALFSRADISLQQFLDFLSYYKNEDAYLPLYGIAKDLRALFRLLIGEKRQQIADIGRGFFEPILDRIGYIPSEEEEIAVSSLREDLIWTAALFGSQKTQDFIHQQFSQLKAGTRIHPGIYSSVLRATANTAKDAFEELVRLYKKAETEQERTNITEALGCLKNKEDIQNALKYLVDGIPYRNWRYILLRMGQNVSASSLLWQWLAEHFDRFEKTLPKGLPERLVYSVVPYAGLGREDEAKRFFANRKPKEENVRVVTDYALEGLAIHSHIRKAHF
ncbi:MAG: M1 family metallopeptidase [Candidatus Hodarchaeota archaeon]